MNKTYNVAIAIRSFDLKGSAFVRLQESFNISFINKSGHRLEETELINALKDVHAVIAGTELYTANVIESSPTLKIISRVGIGVDNIDRNVTKRKGIIVLNTPDAPVQAVAEHALALLLSITKRTVRYNKMIHDGDYSIEPGSLVAGKTVGIIGFGRIGQRLARIMECLGCNILYFDPFSDTILSKTWKPVNTLNELLSRSDIISLNSSAQPENRPLLTNKEFDLCRRGVIILNTARGSLIDEEALKGALENGQVSAAGLDVFQVEPYKGPLLKYPQVVITPHVASNTYESRQQMEIESIENMISALRKLIL